MATNNSINLPTAATGGIVISQGVGNSFSTLPLGTVPGTSPTSTGAILEYDNPLQTMRYYQDFICVTGPGEWFPLTSNGGGSTIPAMPDSGHPGVVQINTGTNTNGAAVFALSFASSGSNLGNIILGGGVIDCYMVFQLPVLSNGTDTYEASIGFGDSFNFPNTSFDDGVFFNYSSTINSGNWQASTSASTVKTVLNSAVAVGTSYTTLRFTVNADATLCTFYVNGISIGTISTNIPTHSCGPLFLIGKSAGTANRVLNIDMVYMFQQLTNPR
jgi:hypothetical protein